MKPLLLTLLLAVSTQQIVYDKFSDTRYYKTQEVEVYRNKGGLLLYNPASVKLQVITSPKSSTLLLSVDSFDWQFTGDCKIAFIADGEHFNLPCKVDSYHAYTLMRDTYVSEYLSIESSDLGKIFNSSKVEMKVGAYEFAVKDKHLKALRLAFPPK